MSNPAQGLPSYVPQKQNEDSDFASLDSDLLWDKFQKYVGSNLTKHTAKCRVLYAKQYIHVLKESNAQDLLLLSEEKRIHVMKSLAAFSKYLGCYDRWNDIRERYQLKWSNNEDSLQE